MLIRIPPILQSCVFSRLRFDLELQEDIDAGADVLLRLRRDLRQAAREILGRGERFNALFDPPLAADPVARRRFQRPGPPFVLLPPPAMPRLEAGDTLQLTVVFWGEGRQGIADFIRVLQTFGVIGLHRREGRFELAGVNAEAAAGTFRPLWRPGEDFDRLEIPFQDARWWLETAIPSLPVRLIFRTPARLITDGRPLFRGNFARLFPFLLRRVTSMLHAHCGVEALDDPRQLIDLAKQVTERENTLAWQDWRVLAGEEKTQQFGGLLGSLRLDGEPLRDLGWVLGLGSLMNVGKGAAFAAGAYSLD